MYLSDASKNRLFASMSSMVGKRYPDFRDSVFADRKSFERRYARVFHRLNKRREPGQYGDPAILYRDKLVFNSVVRSFSYNAVEDIALVRGDKILILEDRVWRPLSELSAHCQGEVFFKLRGGKGGKQAFHAVLEAGGWQEPLAEMAREGEVLMQRRVHQHPEMSAFNASSLNTLRVLTINTNGRAQAVGAAIRIGRKNAAVDNLSAGGIYCLIDVQTAALIGPARGSGAQEFTAHPDSGLVLAGASVPFFPEALDVCQGLHLAIGAPLTVAWDIAVTERGPLVVEGNTQWDGRLHLSPDAQVCYRLSRLYLEGLDR